MNLYFFKHKKVTFEHVGYFWGGGRKVTFFKQLLEPPKRGLNNKLFEIP